MSGRKATDASGAKSVAGAIVIVLAAAIVISWPELNAQQQPPTATMKSNADIVREQAQEQAAQPPSTLPGPNSASLPATPGMYMGAVSCAGSSCHGSAQPIANSNVLQNEYDTWFHAKAPTHVKAFDVLLLPRSQRIARNMHLSTAAEKSKICLDCHALNVSKSKLAGNVEITDGVSCESCHGPAGGWRAQHFQSGWTHAESVKNGMVDLRDLRVRDELCLSCHMGDATKQVDHELIGAGHPILTFELDNFTESQLMPRHWKRLSEKPTPGDRAETHGIRAWAVGQAVTFREGVEHVARHARSDRWPEFADMSCANCHHALNGGEWRQERGYKLRAGLPQWSPQRYAVLRNLVQNVAPDESAALDRDVATLAGAVARMNQTQDIIAAAGSIDRTMARVVPKVESTNWSEARIRSLMSTIARDGDYYRFADRQSAEQATYALVSLSSYLVKANPRLVRSDMMKTVDQLYRQLESMKYPDEFDTSKFTATMQRLDSQVR